MPMRVDTIALNMLRRSKLAGRLSSSSMSSPPGAPKVEVMKMREDGLRSSKLPAPGSDIVTSLPGSKLVEVSPEPDGWYAVYVIDESAKAAIDVFLDLARDQYKVPRCAPRRIAHRLPQAYTARNSRTVAPLPDPVSLSSYAASPCPHSCPLACLDAARLTLRPLWLRPRPRPR